MSGVWNPATFDGLVRNIFQISQTHPMSYALYEYIKFLFKTKNKIVPWCECLLISNVILSAYCMLNTFLAWFKTLYKSKCTSLYNRNSILQLPGNMSCDPDHGCHSKMFLYKNMGMLSVFLFHWLHVALNGRCLIENTSVLL